MRFVGTLLALALLAACGQGVKGDDTSARTIARATVTDVAEGSGPILCDGAVRESAPPQCEGPIISNWDWSKVWGASGEEGARFGEFCVTGKDVGDQFQLSASPRPVGTCGKPEYVATSATVLEDGSHGPQLCLGAIMMSLPAQCGGPDVPNWDWAAVAGETRRNATIDGIFDVRGVYVDGDFTLTAPPRAWQPSDVRADEPAERDFTTPCPEPSGGWFPKGRVMLGEADQQRAIERASSSPTYAELWLDQSHHAHPETNDPAKLILNVRVTKDPHAMEASLREVWGGALCVSTATFTDKELRRIQQGAGARAGRLLLMASAGDDHVDLEVILDEGGRLQKEFDKEYGTGVVRVTSALQPAPPGM